MNPSQLDRLQDLRILILDHAVFVAKQPVHGAGLSLFDTLRAGGLRRVVYHAQCLVGGGSVYTLDTRDGRGRFSMRREQIGGIRIAASVRYFLQVCAAIHHFWRSDHEVCIAVNPLNFLVAFVLSRLRHRSYCVAFAADFSPRRFEQPLLNLVYKLVERFSVNAADQVWSVSRAIQCLRMQQGVPERRNIHVPNSPRRGEFSILPVEQIQRRRIVCVFGGSIVESQLLRKLNFAMLFEVVGELLTQAPDLELHLIGRGPLDPALGEMIASSPARAVTVYLDLPKRDQLVTALCHAAVGVAFYELGGAEHLRYGDSMKIREYLAAGLPAVTTPGHSLAQEITEHRIGLVVSTRQECRTALEQLLFDDQQYLAMRERVGAYARRFDKQQIVLDALARMLHN